MLLHLTLVWAPGSLSPTPAAVELVIDTSVVQSTQSLIDALAQTHTAGPFTVAGEPLESLTFAVAPLVNGSVIVAGATVRPPYRLQKTQWRPSLVFVACSGPDAGQVTALRRGTYSVGRTGTDIVLDDPEVSRLHAFLTVEKNQVTLRDNSSANGTWVDGSLITDTSVTASSTLQFGGSRCALALLDHRPPVDPAPDLAEPLQVRCPTPPTTTPPMIAAALLPLVLGVVLAVSTGMWLFLGFSILSACVGLATLLTQRRGRRSFSSALAEAAEADRRRRQRAARDVGSLALGAFAPVTPDRVEAPGQTGGPIYVRLGEGTQPAHIVVSPTTTKWTCPVLADVPVTIELRTRGTTFPPPEICLSGPELIVLGVARSVLLQLAHQLGSAICVGSPTDVPADARFLPGVILADTSKVFEDLSPTSDPTPVLMFGASAEWNLSPSRAAVIFRFGYQHQKDLPINAGTVRLTVDLGDGRALLRGIGREIKFRPDLVSTQSFGRLARAFGGLPGPPGSAGGAQIPGGGSPAPPGHVSLDRIAPSTPGQVISAWAASQPGLAAPIGRGADGTVVFNLVSDGPHLVIAGTTGSGKSELLRTLILSIALHHSPTEVNFLLIDFKGGAALRPLLSLPHSVGLLTDLSAAAAARALVSLLAEIRRRERLFAEHLVTDISGWPAPSRPVLPRLAVVIDEFRMLVEDVPGATAELMRIATLGRSLGIHLIMATQRPQGALGPDIRANVTTSIALRVGTALESHDVIGSAAAAAIPVGLPGRAFLSLGTAIPMEFQAASSSPENDEEATPCAGILELADYRRLMSAGRSTSQRRHSAGDNGPVKPGPVAPSEVLARLVAVVAHAALEAPPHSLHHPVLPELPPVLSLVVDTGRRDASLHLGLLDLPEEQTQRHLLWSPDEHSHLALIGYPAGGTAASLVYIVDQLQQGLPERHLYLLDGDGSLGWVAPAPQVGAYVGANDLKRAARVLRRLSEFIAVRLSGAPDGDGGRRAGPAVSVIV
ncbi:FtsK/SpoIIIE domain-containing protein, partial [Arthrobacter sp. H20]|uniref:FtsK/SpoIIIE domain-containing protein n=1 Tax=Arthrobacter sp. H20 TaxID=1267981 RepID=UPI0012DC8464